MNQKQPWDGRDLTNSNKKTIYRTVFNQKTEHKKCKNQPIVDPITVSNCINTNLFHKGQSGPLTVKVPVVLAEPQIEINLESVVKLQEPAIEIKRIRKSVEIIQCKLLPPFYRDETPVFKLFLAGFVRKNIEYATAECVSWHGVNGNIRHTTVKVPFSCSTEIKLAPGVTPSLEFQDTNPAAEMEFLDPHKKLRRDQRESGNINAEFLNEKPFCELVKAVVIELDQEADNHLFKKGVHMETAFQTIKEKMIVLVTLKVLQNQQVLIPKDKKYKDEYEYKDTCKHEYEEEDDY